MDLAGQAVIVTGSSSGIGAAIARRLSGLGAGIVVNSASSEAGQRAAAELSDAIYVQGDVADPATAAALICAAEQRWDVLTAWSTTPGSPWTGRRRTSARSPSIVVDGGPGLTI
jgi:NAD(P)-dependent dehydrogenase (short-subunit alcohol dehydrogenase family)